MQQGAFYASAHTCSQNLEAESSRFTCPSTVGGCDVVHIGRSVQSGPGVGDV